ncbi:MAG: hypothetical protein LBC28_00445, partial [Oscillospiraceae bacterium]|nr:hypothetical protein [Oscillospiraceae bacterium]
GRSGAREQIERVAHRLEAAERAADRERAVSGERIRQVVERIEGAESAEASERVVSRERLRQVIERLEAAERAEGAESVVSRERLRQVLERIEAVEAREAGEDAVSRERIRQVIERLEHADDERRRESIVTRERIRQVIERLEAAAQGESRESSLTKTRIEEVIEQIGGADAEKTRRDYRDRQARAPKTWYAPFTLALSKAFSRELLRDRTGLVRGESDKLEEVVTPVMRERYRALTKSFSDELLSRARGTPSNRGSVFNLLFKEERLGDTSAETNNIFNIFSRRLSERNVTGEGARDAATRAYMESVSGNALRYASPVRLGEAPTPAASPPAGDMTADELGALPAWARDFIREGVERRGSAASGDAGAVRRGMTALTDITSSSVGGQAMSGSVDGDTVVWSAPKITSAPAPTALRRDGGAEERRTAPERLSDTEIQRMADKVYGIIESRVSLERRRLGY